MVINITLSSHTLITTLSLSLSLSSLFSPSLNGHNTFVVGENSNHHSTVNLAPGGGVNSQGDAGLSVSLVLDPPKYVTLPGGWVESGGGA